MPFRAATSRTRSGPAKSTSPRSTSRISPAISPTTPIAAPARCLPPRTTACRAASPISMPAPGAQEPAKAAAIREFVGRWIAANRWSHANPKEWVQAYYVNRQRLKEAEAARSWNLRNCFVPAAREASLHTSRR